MPLVCFMVVEHMSESECRSRLLCLSLWLHPSGRIGSHVPGSPGDPPGHNLAAREGAETTQIGGGLGVQWAQPRKIGCPKCFRENRPQSPLGIVEVRIGCGCVFFFGVPFSGLVEGKCKGQPLNLRGPTTFVQTQKGHPRGDS